MREKIFFKNILPIFMVFINLALSVSVVLSHALCPKFAEFGRKNQFGGDCDPEQGRHHQQVDDERQLAGYHRKQTFR